MSVSLNGGLRSSDVAEQQLIRSIISGEFPAGGELPPERNLSLQLGVGRPALREALQRLERDGWLTLRQGRPALVNDYWQKGNLYTLVNLAQAVEKLSQDFIVHLLELRTALAPVYISQAVAKNPAKVVALLADWEALAEQAEAYAVFDWELHKKTAVLCGNPLYVLLLNSFDPVYIPLAIRYFQPRSHRQASRRFYAALLAAAMAGDAARTEIIVREAMLESIALWQEKGAAEDQAP